MRILTFHKERRKFHDKRGTTRREVVAANGTKAEYERWVVQAVPATIRRKSPLCPITEEPSIYCSYLEQGGTDGLEGEIELRPFEHVEVPHSTVDLIDQTCH